MSVKRQKNEKLLACLENIADFGNTTVEVGWLQAGAKHKDSKMTMAQLAYILLYGAVISNKETGKSINIPPRPLFKVSVEEYSKDWTAATEILAKAILSGKIDVSRAAEILGARIADDLKRIAGDPNKLQKNAPITIHGGWMRNPKNNKPFFVEGKGKDTPLVDTGVLRDAITHLVHIEKSGGLK